MSSKSLLRLNGVSKSFAGVHALTDVNLNIDAGEVVCFAGENGSGKSTLVKVLAGVVAPNAGTIEVDGRIRSHWQPFDATRRRRPGDLSGLLAVPNLTVAENISFNYELAKRRRLVAWRERGCGRNRRWRKSASPSTSTPWSSGLASPTAGGGDRPSARRRRTPDRHGRADHRAHRARGPGLARGSASPQGGRRRGRLHQPQAAGSVRHRRAYHRLRQRPQGGGRSDRRVRRRFRCPSTCSAGNSDQHAGRAQPGARSPSCYGSKVSAAPAKLENVSFSLRAGDVLGVTGLLGSAATPWPKALFGLAPAIARRIVIGGRDERVASPLDAMRLGRRTSGRSAHRGLFLHSRFSRQLASPTSTG